MSIARRRLALVVVFALVCAIALPTVGLAKGKGTGVLPAGVTAQEVYSPDAYESADDTWTTAPTISASTKQYHTFESSPSADATTNDIDWFKVSVTATGQPIIVRTERISGYRYDVVISIYGSNGASASCNQTTTIFDDDTWEAGGDTGIYYKTPAPGTYYVRVSPYDMYPTGGPNYSRDTFNSPLARNAAAYNLHVQFGDAQRMSGADRYATNRAVSKFRWPQPDDIWWWDYPDEQVILVASGADWADALAAGSLAGNDDELPLILTPPTMLPSAVADEINRLSIGMYWDGLKPCEVWILGGPTAVSPAVETAVKALPYVTSVKRVAGTNRYGTAAAIGDELDDIDGVGSDAILVSGESFADALAAGAIAGYEELPILMTGRNMVPAETVQFMNDYGITDVVVCGGSSAVSTVALDSIQALVSDTQVFTRLAGADRYETAYKVAQHGVYEYGMEGSQTVLVSGTSFPDGLSAAMLVSDGNIGPILLTPAAALSSRVESYYAANDGFDDINWVVGGTSAVSSTAFNQLNDLWKKPF